MAVVLGKREHLGRVRGVGEVTITDYFGHASGGKSFEGAGVGEHVVALTAKEIQEIVDDKLLKIQETHAQSQAESHEKIQKMEEFIVQLLDKMKKDNPDLPTAKFGQHVLTQYLR